ncbi:MAG TPA: hypothetical protein VEY92_13755 [Pseudoxanthomonas sp.]|nr:hypothetical protein [Pseudoxanthomonas sp.]
MSRRWSCRQGGRGDQKPASRHAQPITAAPPIVLTLMLSIGVYLLLR